MIAVIKQLFKTKDEKNLDKAAEEFDILMNVLNEDAVDLAMLDGHVRAEFNEIRRQIENDSAEEDENDQ